MKLNKVLALALSGVMAVSMLAGCKGSTPDDGGQEQDQVTGLAAAVNAALDTHKDDISFTSNSTIESALNAAMVKVADNEITTVNNGNYALDAVTNSDEPAKSLSDALKDFNVVNGQRAFNTTIDADNTETTTATVVYSLKTGLTEERMAELIAEKVDSFTLPATSAIAQDATEYNSFDYTGSVSIATATTKDGTVSAYYIVISVTQTVSKVAIG